jgi:hypothetical protein
VETEDFLAHYGVKGMKWGRRKSKSTVRGRRPGTRKYDPKKLSNSDLKKITARMKLEQDYAKLNTKTKKKGENVVQKTMKTLGSIKKNEAMLMSAFAAGSAAVGFLLSKKVPGAGARGAQVITKLALNP